jgi:ribokinase
MSTHHSRRRSVPEQTLCVLCADVTSDLNRDVAITLSSSRLTLEFGHRSHLLRKRQVAGANEARAEVRLAVVGHVEWCSFARVERVPAPGEIVQAVEVWEQPAGSGAVAAVQIARLAGECLFLTALAENELGRRAKRELEAMGLRVEAAWRAGSQRRAFVHLDADGERTITVTGRRIEPHASDPLPWAELADVDAIYLTAGDSGAVRAARAARELVATVRAGEALASSGIEVDVLVMSADDTGERYRPGDFDPTPLAIVRTEGAAGGWLETVAGKRTRWPAATLPGPRMDSYGAGDSFAGGLTYALGLDSSIDKALALAARCGAACVTGRGPYEGQLTDAGERS